MSINPPVVDTLGMRVAEAVARSEEREGAFVIEKPFTVASGNSLTIQTPHMDDEYWANEQVNKLHVSARLSVISTYNELVKHSGRRVANVFLDDAVRRYAGMKRTYLFPRQAMPTRIKDLGSYHAKLCLKAVNSGGLDFGILYCCEQGITPPYISQSATAPEDMNSQEAAIKRMSADSWWKRKLNRKRLRDAELKRIKRGIIGKGKQVYCSDVCTEDFRISQERALAFMSNIEAVSDDGCVVDMLDVFESSLANPKNRRAELNTRVWGFAEYAKEYDHKAEFYTLTAPSKYHRTSRKYAGFTPRETQKYLTDLWKQIRSRLKDHGLEIYGVRIVEPHKDSTPHWHMLFFMTDEHREAIRSIIREYALREDGNERGAIKARFQYEALDSAPEKIIAYVGKYIAKNIDGHGVSIDHETGDLSTNTATRVRAWASRWGIRQFQQIGGAPVGVWRELRKLKKTSNDEAIERARVAADCGKWKNYLEAQGGALVKRKDQLIRTFNETCIDADTGEIKLSPYGEFTTRVKGLQSDTGRIKTRLVDWEIKPKQQKPVLVSSKRSAVAWHSGNNCTEIPEQITSSNPELRNFVIEQGSE